jgi:HlyD family secretion protein
MAAISKSALKWVVLVVIAVGVVAFVGVKWWSARESALPAGIVSGNGRIEGQLVDVAPKEALRVDEMLVDEGALVKPGQVVVRMDTSTLQAQLVEAKANVVAAQEAVAAAEAAIVKQTSEINLAAVETKRSQNLVRQGAGSQREVDVRRTRLETTKASLAAAQAELQTAKQKVQVARDSAAVIQTRIDDATLRSPVTGRVLYRLAQPGEVLGPGGKALTLVNLDDLYMEIFIPSEQAASVKIGAEGRITADFDPSRAVAGKVSFVSPQAQFTPKQVETRSEREKLMFRVKIQVPKEVASQYVERVKTGIRGMGYVKTTDSAVWPPWLSNLLALQPAAR